MKKSKFIVLLLLFCLQPGFLAAQRAEAIRKDVLNPHLDKVLVVAHRGNWSIAPENSLAAIDSAIRMKVDIVEIDIRKTKDGQLVLMHDDTVDRTTNGTGKVKDKTLAEIKQLRLKDKDGRLTEHTVPTLEEALLAAKAGATYVSPFLGRLDDISTRGVDLIREIAEIFEVAGIETEIIAASVRNPIHVTDCALAGADIATVPYNVIVQMTKHPLTDAGIEKFQKDYKAVFGE
mgnify:CR=1 FL=1